MIENITLPGAVRGIAESGAVLGDVDLRVVIADVDVLLVVDSGEVRPAVPGVVVRPALEEAGREDVVPVVRLLGAAARGQEQLGHGAGAEQHARSEHDLGREEPVPNGAVRAVLVELVEEGDAEVVLRYERDGVGEGGYCFFL